MPFVLGAFGRVGVGPNCYPVSHLVEPASYRLTLADGSSLADKDEEGGLEGVLGILLMIQDAAAYVEDHGSMPPNQHFEGRLVARDSEPF